MMTNKEISDRELDAALALWATNDAASLQEAAGDQAAVLRILQHADAIATSEPRHQRRWWIGGAVAVAASVAIAWLVSPGLPGTSLAPAGGAGDGSVILAQVDADESAAFALLYTPTSEEEYQL